MYFQLQAYFQLQIVFPWIKITVNDQITLDSCWNLRWLHSTASATKHAHCYHPRKPPVHWSQCPPNCLLSAMVCPAQSLSSKHSVPVFGFLRTRFSWLPVIVFPRPSLVVLKLRKLEVPRTVHDISDSVEPPVSNFMSGSDNLPDGKRVEAAWTAEARVSNIGRLASHEPSPLSIDIHSFGISNSPHTFIVGKQEPGWGETDCKLQKNKAWMVHLFTWSSSKLFS